MMPKIIPKDVILGIATNERTGHPLFSTVHQKTPAKKTI